MDNPPATIRPAAWMIAIVLAAMVAGGIAVWQSDPWGDQGNRLSQRFDYDLETHKKTDPALIGYRQTGEFPAVLNRPRAIAVGPEDRIYLAGDQAIVVLDRDGAKSSKIDLEEPPRCLAVARANDGQAVIYVGMKTHVEVYDAQGSRQASWPDLGAKAMLTSLAASEADVFAADAGNRIVWHYDLSGKPLGQIGRRDAERDIPGFVIPSPYFDLAVSPDGLLRVANPGAHRVEGYTFDGHLEVVWGKPSLGIEGFCGCCNPANFAVLPDGRFVTAEKGIPRVKVYSEEGQFESVVAGPEVLTPTATITEETRSDYKLTVFDVAADSQGRVLVLDPTGHRVRLFEPLVRHDKGQTEAKHE